VLLVRHQNTSSNGIPAAVNTLDTSSRDGRTMYSAGYSRLGSGVATALSYTSHWLGETARAAASTRSLLMTGAGSRTIAGSLMCRGLLKDPLSGGRVR